MADLSVRDLTVEYQSGDYTLRPLDQFSLEVAEGSLVLLLGPSGCGKTTLLSCLGAILTPTSGSIHLGDIDVTALAGSAVTDYRRDKVGIMFQASNLLASLTALENVSTPLWAAGVGKREAKRRATELLDGVGLADRVHHKPAELSGGQQQRVAAARALSLDPTLVLADEPTAHLDYVQVEDMMSLVRDLATDERIVIVSSHDHRLIPIADRVVEMVPDFMNLTVPPETLELEPGQVLFRQGSRGERIYVVEQGTVDIVREHTDGDEEHRVTMEPGDYFGEMGPLFGLPRTATARARTAARVTGYSLRDFRERVGEEGMKAILDRHSTKASATTPIEP